jgi:hypothetical protein
MTSELLTTQTWERRDTGDMYPPETGAWGTSHVFVLGLTTTIKPIIPRVAVASHYSGAAEFIQNG